MHTSPMSACHQCSHFITLIKYLLISPCYANTVYLPMLLCTCFDHTDNTLLLGGKTSSHGPITGGSTPSNIPPSFRILYFIVGYGLITGRLCLTLIICPCNWVLYHSAWSSSPPKGEVWRTANRMHTQIYIYILCIHHNLHIYLDLHFSSKAVAQVVRWHQVVMNKWVLLHCAWISQKFCTGLLHSRSTLPNKDYWYADRRIATQAI